MSAASIATPASAAGAGRAGVSWWRVARGPLPSVAPAGEDARPAVFLDKDGTLVDNLPYNVDPARLRFTPRAIEALQALDAAGYALVIVTNQPGLASGRFTRAEFARLQEALTARVQAHGGPRLTGFQVCPHAPAVAAADRCLCRKPAPGLLHQAARRHGLDLARSWMVGDILDDIEAGRRAGTRTVLMDVGNETEWRVSPLRTPHHCCGDLLAAAEHILATDAATGHGAASAAGVSAPGTP